MTHVFKHPKFYRIPRDKSDQVISGANATAKVERAPGPGHKPQAPSSKQQAIEESVPYTDIIEASSSKPQALSFKRQAPQAASHKLQALRYKRQA